MDKIRYTVVGSCWIPTNKPNPNGYVQVHREGKQHYAHRLSYAHYHGPIPAGLEVHHTCLNRACFNPRHLTLLTHLENVQKRAPRKPRPEHLEVWRRTGAGESVASVARDLGLRYETARLITKRRPSTWPHFPETQGLTGPIRGYTLSVYKPTNGRYQNDYHAQD